jgi:hypothetical protein
VDDIDDCDDFSIVLDIKVIDYNLFLRISPWKSNILLIWLLINYLVCCCVDNKLDVFYLFYLIVLWLLIDNRLFV